MFLLTGCDRKTNIEPPCPPLPVVDGYVTIKTRGGITLRFPDGYTRLFRSSEKIEKGGCQILERFESGWYWDKEKKKLAQRNNGGGIFIQLSYNGKEGYITERPKVEAWRYDSALPHKFYPLAYYPKSRWSSPDGPRKETGYDYENYGLWGVLDTKNTFEGKPFMIGCFIPPRDAKNWQSSADNEVYQFSLFPCSGSIQINHNNQFIDFGIEVTADGVPEINHIYDAAIEQLQNLIQE